MAKRKRHAAKRKTSRQKEKDSKQKEKLAASCHLGQWDDLIISQLQAIFQLSVISPPQKSFGKVAN